MFQWKIWVKYNRIEDGIIDQFMTNPTRIVQKFQSPPSSSIDLHHSCFVFNHLSKTSTKRENFKTHHHHHHLLTSSERKREAGFNQSTFWIWISRKRETWGMKKHSFIDDDPFSRVLSLLVNCLCLHIFHRKTFNWNKSIMSIVGLVCKPSRFPGLIIIIISNWIKRYWLKFSFDNKK